MKCETKNINNRGNTNNFKMLIPTKVWEQVYVMIHSTPKEIGALMSCIIEGTDILVTDIHIPKQTVTSTECLFDKDDQADIVFKVTMQDDNVINGWIHSHVNMHTAFSCTDDATITKLLAYTDTDLNSIWSVYVSGKYAYAVSTDTLCIIDVSNPTNPGIVGVFDSSNLTGARSVYVSGKYAYVAASIDDTLTIIDVSNPTIPSLGGGIKDTSTL